ncbi:MAG: hypothetical protein WA323_08590 [Candidatus Nitrosopolaris sp.]
MADCKTIGMGAGDDDVTCPNNGYNDSQCDQFNDEYDAGFNSTCIVAHKNSTWGCPAFDANARLNSCKNFISFTL